jgi:HemY protein
MKRLLRIVLVTLVFLICLVVAAMIFEDRGYVFVEFSGWAIEMNVFSLAISLLAIFIGLLLTNWLIQVLLHSVNGSRDWFGGLGRRKQQHAFRQGLIALAENNYVDARNWLSKIKDNDFDGINLLAAAQVEWQLGDTQKAKSLWVEASTIEASALAAKLCLIRQALHQQQASQALELIAGLSDKQRDQAVVIKLWAQALLKAARWSELKNQLPHWKKALGTDYDALSQAVSKGTFAEIASKEGANQLKQSWQALPRGARKDPSQQAAYIQQLLDQGMHKDAEQMLVECQKSGPQALLFPLYKQIKLPNPSMAIKQLESWLKQDDSNVELLSTLGHLAYNANDTVLAEKALGRAIKLANRQQDLRLMAALKESQHDKTQALMLYKQSMKLSN